MIRVLAVVLVSALAVGAAPVGVAGAALHPPNVNLVESRVKNPAATAKPILWVYGDSINWESFRYSKGVLAKTYHVRSGAFPGSAPCDNIGFLKRDLAIYAKNKPAKYPKYIIFDTVGNSLATCMIDPNTGQPYVPGTAPYYQKYAADIQAFSDLVTQEIGAKLLFLAPPPARDGDPAIQSAIEADELATGNPVAYEPQQAVAPGNVYADTLPCLSTEHKGQGCVNGMIAVRAPDGVHFCPDAAQFPQPCPVYSSGEKRWANATGVAAGLHF